jgi:peptide subunit release factor 1 (eRF1)
LFRDKYDVMQGLKQENSELKQQNQISDNTRKNLEVQHPDKTQRRKDYPETPATAMKNYICNLCGKDFQSKDQLTKHEEFEFKGKGHE